MDLFAVYCPHSQNWVQRTSTDAEWKITRNVSEKKAVKYFARGIEQAKAFAQSQGMEWDQFDAVVRGVEKLKQVGKMMRSIQTESDDEANR